MHTDPGKETRNPRPETRNRMAPLVGRALCPPSGQAESGVFYRKDRKERRVRQVAADPVTEGTEAEECAERRRGAPERGGFVAKTAKTAEDRRPEGK